MEWSLYGTESESFALSSCQIVLRYRAVVLHWTVVPIQSFIYLPSYIYIFMRGLFYTILHISLQLKIKVK